MSFPDHNSPYNFILSKPSKKNFAIKLNTEFMRKNFMLVYLVLSYYEIQLNIFCRDKVKEDILFNAYLKDKKKSRNHATTSRRWNK